MTNFINNNTMKKATILLIIAFVLTGCTYSTKQEQRLNSCIESGSKYEVCTCLAINPQNLWNDCYEPTALN